MTQALTGEPSRSFTDLFGFQSASKAATEPSVKIDPIDARREVEIGLSVELAKRTGYADRFIKLYGPSRETNKIEQENEGSARYLRTHARPWVLAACGIR